MKVVWLLSWRWPHCEPVYLDGTMWMTCTSRWQGPILLWHSRILCSEAAQPSTIPKPKDLLASCQCHTHFHHQPLYHVKGCKHSRGEQEKESRDWNKASTCQGDTSWGGGNPLESDSQLTENDFIPSHQSCHGLPSPQARSESFIASQT